MKIEGKASRPVIGAIIEVRMTSSRLPGKHLLKSNGLPMINRLLRRIKSIKLFDHVILATTTNVVDDIFVEVAEQEGTFIFRGSELDVMGRVLHAATSFSIDIICEITGDCPLFDTELTSEALQNFLSQDLDYLNNGTSGLPDGLGCQIFTTRSLETSYSLTNKELDFEHVTAHIIRNPDIFFCDFPEVPKSFVWPSLSLSLDEQGDYQVLNEIIIESEKSDFFFGTETIISFLRNRPDLLAINNKIRRRGYE